ncbi:GNAT family N-acetyltransferase [Pseudanabaena mucicola]|uniref:GNAT family N-acetyltransferase n=1 Tax=Pseudanabaena mucicola FACHB-723 TaxID=2692860 RepID=A0ABR7ZYW0_9CYAN|nr:GNAT family N-acetyltransferase [Pseudanabaena mucicola]MBD2188262.1 GNAT family N-acetyltransferase [Pseudanabaena mucicola FACHB-723]
MQPFPTIGNTIRPLQHRDLEFIQRFASPQDLEQIAVSDLSGCRSRQKVSLHQLASWLPAPVQTLLKPYVRAYVCEYNGIIQGFIRVSPFNNNSSTWQIDRVVVLPEAQNGQHNVGTQLIRYCLESCLEARTWVLQVDINQKDTIALYRQNGFQPLAQFTDWELDASSLHELAQHSPDLPNLMPVSNADASLLYQLDTAAMPPHIRQVYDLNVDDFRAKTIDKLVNHSSLLINHLQDVSGYVYEPQRKAAIGYFYLLLQRPNINHGDEKLVHHCQLTVHPAYTWLYPELTSQIARIVTKQTSDKTNDQVSLQISSADYQPEREDYLESIHAQRQGHSLLMARSVWHKIRETKPVLDGLQLSRMLSGLQPTQKPIPGRIDTLPQSHQHTDELL